MEKGFKFVTGHTAPAALTPPGASPEGHRALTYLHLDKHSRARDEEGNKSGGKH